MERTTRVLGLLLVLFALTLPASADKAKSLYEKGRDAEARQNYEQAFEYYKQAYELKPKDIRYRTTYERTKFLAAAAHVHRGQLLREAGKLQEALAEFEKARSIDPTNFLAEQELRTTRDMINAPPPQQPEKQDVLRQLMEHAQGPVLLKPVSDQPITLHMTEDSKVIYTTVGKLAGINVLFDPDYTSRRISVDLNNVTLYQALEIVAMQSKTFWRPVTPNTIYVAADTKPKRTEIEQSVVKTFYLQNLSQPTELQDVQNTLRQILDIQKLTPLNSQGAIVVRGTPDQVALAEKLVSDLDKARAEVIVEVAVMQVSRDKLRDLGINPGSLGGNPATNATIQLQPNVTTSTATNTTTNTTNTTTTGTTGTTGSVNLNHLGNLTAKDFTVTLPTSSISFLLSDATTKMIQNPQIRALDGQKASLKIGERIPIATGSFQPGIGGIGINPLVNTQFNYQDVGVNIDMTPTVHNNGEVTLKITLDISSVTGQSNIGGITQPIIGQRKIEHTIRLREGEVNMMGGIMEEQDIKNMSGLPFIGQVPILKYLFSTEHTERHDNEIVFAVIPRMVRGANINEANTRAVDVGTASNVELRYNPKNNGNPAPPGPGAGAVARPSSPTSPQPGTAAMMLSLDPPQLNQTVGSTFAVNVVLNGATNVNSVPVQIGYDPKSLQLVNVSNGGFLSRDGQAVALVMRPDLGAAMGNIQVAASRPPNSGGASGQGPVFTLTFMAKAAGQSVISINQAGARDGSMQAIPMNGAQAMVTVK